MWSQVPYYCASWETCYTPDRSNTKALPGSYIDPVEEKPVFLQGVVLALCWRQAAHDAIKSPSVTGSSSITNAEDLYYFVQIKAGYETEKPFCWQKWASFNKPVKQKPCETEFTHSNSIRKAQSKRYLYPKTRANLCSEHNHCEIPAKMNQDSSHKRKGWEQDSHQNNAKTLPAWSCWRL
jgi:hypothetical protein